MSDVTIPGGRIRSFVERIENLDTELQELNEQKKEVFSEAKAEGFDVKILKEIIKLRKQDQEERDERDGLLDLYMRAMEQAARRRSRRRREAKREARMSDAICGLLVLRRRSVRISRSLVRLKSSPATDPLFALALLISSAPPARRHDRRTGRCVRNWRGLRE